MKAFIIFFLVFLLSCNNKKELNIESLLKKESYTNKIENDLFSPIPESLAHNPAIAKLGKKLFFDPRLSKNDTISCSSCHQIDKNGADSLAFSIGINNQAGTLNTPTIYNAIFNIAQFWDGRAGNLFLQIKDPILNSHEMAMPSMDFLIKKLSKIEEYNTSFKKLFKDGLTENNFFTAITEYEKTLITPNSKFDNFLKGEKNALNQKEKNGLKHFKDLGCVSCHNGINLGGNMYQKYGVVHEYIGKNNQLGRYNISKNPDDKYVFKVPSLRNIELTSPYLHDGSIQSLNESIDKMAYYQLGRKLNEKTINEIAAFLKTLTGKKPE